MTNALALSTPFADLMVQADTLVKSGFLPTAVKTKEQAVAIMTMGQELGLGMWAAFNGINVIQGKPTLSPQLMLALIRRSGQLEDIDIQDDGKRCHVTMKRKGNPAPHTESFGTDDAERMMTTEWVNNEKRTIKLSEKYNWKSMPAVMRKWRAVSACARIVFPDVIIGFYTPEEIDPDLSIDFETGEIDHNTPQPEPTPPAPAKAPEPVINGDDLVTGENGAQDAPDDPPQDEPDNELDKHFGTSRLRRPWDADTLRRQIQIKVGKSRLQGPITDDQRTKLVIALNNFFQDQEEPDKFRHSLLTYLRNVDSVTKLNKAEASVLIDWSESGDAMSEARGAVRQSAVDAGQTDMFTPDAEKDAA